MMMLIRVLPYDDHCSSLFTAAATHLGLENAAIIGRLEEEPTEAGPHHDEEQRPPARPRGQHGDCGPQTRN